MNTHTHTHETLLELIRLFKINKQQPKSHSQGFTQQRPPLVELWPQSLVSTGSGSAVMEESLSSGKYPVHIWERLCVDERVCDLCSFTQVKSYKRLMDSNPELHKAREDICAFCTYTNIVACVQKSICLITTGVSQEITKKKKKTLPD